MYDGCRKEILYRSSDQYGCCCFICDRKQQDQAERKNTDILMKGIMMFLCPVVGPLFFLAGLVFNKVFSGRTWILRMLFSARSV